MHISLVCIYVLIYAGIFVCLYVCIEEVHCNASKRTRRRMARERRGAGSSVVRIETLL